MSLVSAIQAPLSISNAIKKASQATGTDFSYLLKTAARESAFKQGAKAKTSSAAGLFQFIESTWLNTVKEAGNDFGLEKYTPHIFKTRSGRLYVPNPKLRQEILQLRHNPEVSAMMAGAFTQKNSEYIASELGRQPTPGELYIAHFLGPSGASKLISLAENKPDARADRSFPRAARANKPIFYSRGRARTAAQVYNELVSDHAKLQAVAAHPINAAPKTAAPEVAKSNVITPVREPAKQVAVASTIDDADAKKAIGLLGQTGSPIAEMTKVASLTQAGNTAAPKTLNDAVPGSIGVWTTNIRLPADEAANTGANKKEKTDEPLVPVKRRVARRRASPRPDGLLEVSAKRNARSAAIRAASAASSFSSANFWGQMALNGN